MCLTLTLLSNQKDNDTITLPLSFNTAPVEQHCSGHRNVMFLPLRMRVMGVCMEFFFYFYFFYICTVKVFSRRKTKECGSLFTRGCHCCLHLQTASVSTHTAWGSSGAITKTSHNSPFFLPLRGCGSDDDGNDDNDNPNLQSF